MALASQLRHTRCAARAGSVWRQAIGQPPSRTLPLPGQVALCACLLAARLAAPSCAIYRATHAAALAWRLAHMWPPLRPAAVFAFSFPSHPLGLCAASCASTCSLVSPDIRTLRLAAGLLPFQPHSPAGLRHPHWPTTHHHRTLWTNYLTRHSPRHTSSCKH